METPRTRRRPDEARALILDAAAALLAEGGVAAVQVRAVAARVGMTDAGVTHHFGNRDNLLSELLRHGGRRVRAALRDVLAIDHGTDLLGLVEALDAVYRNGYGELAIALHAAGWRDHGSGMLDPLVHALHALRPAGAEVDDTRHAVAALHQAMATGAVHGEAFRLSAGLTGGDARDPSEHLRWWARQLHLALAIPTTRPMVTDERAAVPIRTPPMNPPRPAGRPSESHPEGAP